MLRIADKKGFSVLLMYKWLFHFSFRQSSMWSPTCLFKLIIVTISWTVWSPGRWVPMASEYPDLTETPLWRLNHTPVVGFDSCTLLPKNPVSFWRIVLIYIKFPQHFVWAGQLNGLVHKAYEAMDSTPSLFLLALYQKVSFLHPLSPFKWTIS